MEMLNLRLLILLGVLVFGIGIVYGDENECLNGLHYIKDTCIQIFIETINGSICMFK